MKIPQEKLTAFQQIILDELDRLQITWAHFTYGGTVRPIMEARWKIIWRAYNELNLPKYRIATLLELDHSSVYYALRRMRETDGKFFENKPPLNSETIRVIRKKLRKINQDLGIVGEIKWR